MAPQIGESSTDDHHHSTDTYFYNYILSLVVYKVLVELAFALVFGLLSTNDWSLLPIGELCTSNPHHSTDTFFCNCILSPVVYQVHFALVFGLSSINDGSLLNHVMLLALHVRYLSEASGLCIGFWTIVYNN